MNATSHLAKQALACMPKPYTEEVILHVFCEIERTPHLRERYDELVAERGKGTVNRELGRVVGGTLGAKAKGEKISVKKGTCGIVHTVSKLPVASIDLEWSW